MGRVSLACSCFAAVLLGGLTVAGAQEDSGEGDATSAAPKPVYSKKDQAYKHKEGEYGGVTPGVVFPYADEGFARRFKRPIPKRLRKNAVYWTGFQPRDDGSARVFLQLAGEAPYTQVVQGNKLLVTVAGARPLHRNARRRLEVRFFDTALGEVVGTSVSRRRARKGQPEQKPGFQLAITFKNPADAHEAQASFAKEQDGFTYLYLDFGPPTAATPSDAKPR